MVGATHIELHHRELTRIPSIVLVVVSSHVETWDCRNAVVNMMTGRGTYPQTMTVGTRVYGLLRETTRLEGEGGGGQPLAGRGGVAGREKPAFEPEQAADLPAAAATCSASGTVWRRSSGKRYSSVAVR